MKEAGCRSTGSNVFDVDAALAAGFGHGEIAEYLASDGGFDLQAARGAGYDNTEIVAFLARNGA